MLHQSSISSTRTNRQAVRTSKPAKYEFPAKLESDLAPLTEDDDLFVALAAIDLLQRLKGEPL